MRYLFDTEVGTFNQGVFVDSSWNAFGRVLKKQKVASIEGIVGTLGVILRNLSQFSGSYSMKSIRVNRVKDLKYIGHVCVGLSKYILLMDETPTSLLEMLRSSILQLTALQSSKGYILSRFINNEGVKTGASRKEVVETTCSFLWGLPAVSRALPDILPLVSVEERSSRAAQWLMNRTGSLNAQDIGRLIYALSELYDLTRNEQFLEWIDNLCQLLCSRLGNNKSFGHFSMDIDAIGGLSIGSAVLKDDYYCEAKKLVLNQLAQQGPNGEWRWVFTRKSGQYMAWRDITYSVHQMGMGPWPLSLFMASFGWNTYVEEAVEKGLSFVSKMKSIQSGFIVRSCAGMSGVVYQKEQRSYELGLNLLGLISFLIMRGMNEKKLTPSYEHLLNPSKIETEYGITPIELIRRID